MGTDKIKISTDEVYSSGVDNKLKSQDAIARAQQHYQQQISAAQQVSAIKATVPGKTSIWYNAIFYMALFGLIGGIIAWGTSEPFIYDHYPSKPMEMVWANIKTVRSRGLRRWNRSTN